MSTYIRKNNVTHEQKEMPMLFPADRVYLDGDTDKNVQSELRFKQTTKSYTLTNSDSSAYYLVLDANILNTLNAKALLGMYVKNFVGIIQQSDKYLPNLVCDSGKVYTLFVKGKTFSGISIDVTYTYLPN